MSPTSSTLTSFDPWDNSVLAEFAIATEADVAAAYVRARGVLAEWSGDDALRRSVVLALAEGLKIHRDELAGLISRETGKVLWESQLEVDAMVNKCALSIRAQDERRSPTSKTTPAGTLATTYRPLGVVVVLGPFNFPAHLPMGHIIPALIAGNTVLFKPSEKAPAVADRLLSLLAGAGLPAGVVQALQGGPDVARAIFRQPISAVLFTGSHAVGVAINRAFADRPEVLIALEMGGNNPLIAWETGDLDAAAIVVLQSAFATAGQRCSCARRLICHTDDPLPGRVVELAQTMRIGRYSDMPQPFYSALISPAAADHVLKAQEQALATFAPKALLRAIRDPRSRSLVSPGIVEVAAGGSPPDEETFGPLLQVVRVSTFDEALLAANATRYGLSAGLLSDAPELWRRFRESSHAGVLTLNRPTTGASSELPFGGTGHSGNHRPSAYLAADYCSHPVAEMSNASLIRPEKLPPGLNV